MNKSESLIFQRAKEYTEMKQKSEINEGLDEFIIEKLCLIVFISYLCFSLKELSSK